MQLCCYFLTLLCVQLLSFLSDFPQSCQNLLPDCCIDLLPRPVNDANQLGKFMLLSMLSFFQMNFSKNPFNPTMGETKGIMAARTFSMVYT